MKQVKHYNHFIYNSKFFESQIRSKLKGKKTQMAF